MHAVTEALIASEAKAAATMEAYYEAAARAARNEDIFPDEILKICDATPDKSLMDFQNDMEAGRVAGIPARLWWKALHLFLFDTGCRIGELLCVRWEWINFKTGYVDVPYNVRKGGERDMTYQLHQETLALLEQIRKPERVLVFPWDRSEQLLWRRYKQILSNAGLPDNAKCMFHKMRRTVASHLQAGGHNASQVLGHSSADITRESYLDPHIVGMVSPSAVLFRPGSRQQLATVASSPAAVERRPVAEPLLIPEEWL